MKEEEELRERLADLEHVQWEHWSKSISGLLKEARDTLKALKGEFTPVYDKIEKKLKNWEQYWIPYEDLEEKVKDYDREWADKVLKIFKTR